MSMWTGAAFCHNCGSGARNDVQPMNTGELLQAAKVNSTNMFVCLHIVCFFVVPCPVDD